MTRPAAPIGVFDSGFGGLSVLRAITHALPHEPLLYCADHAWLPYGEREPEAVRARARWICARLLDAGCKAIVIACNTATAAAAEALRAELDVPVVGMEPAVKPAAAATHNGVIGVLGTGGTLASSRFAGLLQRYAGGLTVLTRPCPELVREVEAPSADPQRRQALVAAAVQPLLVDGADVLVLGCTHFPFLRGAIEGAAGPDVTVIDTGPAVARQLVRRLDDGGLRAGGATPASARFWTTGDARRLAPVLTRMWGRGALEALPGEPSARVVD